jgi:hypothetical protein
MNPRVVKFHPTHSLGKLHLSERNHPGDSVEYLDAQGDVLVPSGMNLELWITNDGLTNLTPSQVSENGYTELGRALPDCQIWYYRSNDL